MIHLARLGVPHKVLGPTLMGFYVFFTWLLAKCPGGVTVVLGNPKP